MRLILASASPRRKALLEEIGKLVIVVPARVSELVSHPEGPTALAVANARLKAQNVYETLSLTDGELVLGADTVVSLGKDVFGKPRDRLEAENMLSRLSGCWHEVITGVCLLSQSVSTEFFEITRVRFHPLKPDEIHSYLDTIYPYDKAGAYAAQEGGERIIAEVSGSFSNIVGLPLEALYNALESENGYDQTDGISFFEAPRWKS